MTFLLVLLVLAFIAWRVRRRQSKLTVAGLNAAKPQFMVEPPLRRLTDRRRETL